MKRILALALALFAGIAVAETVTINGVTHGTGLMRLPKDAPRVYFSPVTAETVPDAYDARTDGFVTRIKDQGQCGSCWAFARSKAFEAALIKAGKATSDTIDLAEQDALVNDHSAYGCQGGFMDGTFEVNQGVTTEAYCPYRASDRVSCNGAKFAKATRWAMIGANGRSPTDDELKAAIYQYGVIAVTVAAGGSFSPGRDGRITSCGSRGINHMVTLVAYRPAADGGVEYLIGNSWGTSWGSAGFAWSKKGCNQLASEAGDAALFFYVEGTPGPKPTPEMKDLPVEVVAYKGAEVALQVRPAAGVKYRWSDGTTGARIYVKADATASYTLTATAADGSKTMGTVKVTPK